MSGVTEGLYQVLTLALRTILGIHEVHAKRCFQSVVITGRAADFVILPAKDIFTLIKTTSNSTERIAMLC